MDAEPTTVTAHFAKGYFHTQKKNFSYTLMDWIL